jgi:hypothetical protein
MFNMILSFKSFFEIYDIENIDVSHIELQRRGSLLSYNFKQKLPNGNVEGYDVMFSPIDYFLLPTPEGDHERINGKFYDITLRGPEGLNLTKVSGSVSNLIYQKILLAIKKLIFQEKVEGFSFSPAEAEMVIPYTRFIEKYLKPMGFIEMKDGYFILQTKLDSAVEELLKDANPEQAEEIRDEIKHHLDRVASGRQETHRQVVADRNIARVYRRNPDLLRQAYLGKFFKLGRYSQYYFFDMTDGEKSQRSPLVAVNRYAVQGGMNFMIEEIMPEKNLVKMTKYEEDEFIRGLHEAIENGSVYAEEDLLDSAKNKIPPTLYTSIGLEPPK